MGEIKKQSLSNVLISYTGLGIGFLNVMLLQPWMLKPEEIGLMRVLYSIAVLGGTIFSLGITGAIIRFLPLFRNKEKGHNGFLGSILLITVPLFLLLSLVVLFFGNIFLDTYYARAPLLKSYSYWVLPMICMVGYSSLLSVYLLAEFQSVKVTWINDFLIRIFTLGIVLLYFFHWVDQKGFFLLFAGVYFFQLLGLFILSVYVSPMLTLFPVKSLWGKETRKAFVSFSLAMAMVNIASMALRNIDVIMVGGMANLEQAAVYSLALLVAGFIELPATAIGKIADTKISDAYQNNNQTEIEKIYDSTTRVLSVTGMFLFAVISVCIADVLYFLPKKFSFAAFPVTVIGLGSLANMCTGINSSILLYTSQVRVITRLTVGLVVLMVVLNYFLIPVAGIKGAALANGMAFILFNFSKWLIIKIKFGWNPYGRWFYHSLLITSFLVAGGLFLPVLPFHPVFSVIGKFITICIAFYALVMHTEYYTEVRKTLHQVIQRTNRKK
jgi:O-antigen/teichoic acid export membrane protein